MKALVANALWLAGCVPAYRRFHRATKRVAATQEALLRKLLMENAETEFGRRHGFASIGSAREYQRRVPVCRYENMSSEIERMASGEQNVLTRERVSLFEPTSGSTNAEKLIPYNRALQREFQAGINAWIADLYLHDTGLLGGMAYWSVSPASSAKRRTKGGIPIGFEDDASYLGGMQKRMVNSLMAVPGEVREIADMETFRYVSLLFLLGQRDLRLISVWNPTFLSLLVSPLREWGEALAKDLESGEITVRGEIPWRLKRMAQANPRRAKEVREGLREGSAAAVHQALWPELRLISCWMDGNSEGAARQLRELFPQARMQGKGLIATEGFVSLPLSGREGAALAICSHFLEFLPMNETGACRAEKPRMANELELGKRYGVVLSTGGGLYRYELQDLVEVVGFLEECPLIRFVARQSNVSDWFGEKLNEAHVSGILREVFGEMGLAPEFAMMACDGESEEPGYVLYVECGASVEELRRATDEIEKKLKENFHYGYARRLGQLAALRVFRTERAGERYLEEKSRRGQRAGGIKLMTLEASGGWEKVFCGGEELGKGRGTVTQSSQR